MPRPIENARRVTGIEPLSTVESWSEKNLEVAVWRLPGNGALKFATVNHFACVALGAIENQVLCDGAGNHLRSGPVARGRFRLVQGPAQFESRVVNSAPIEMLNIYFSTRLMNQITRDLGQRPKRVALKDPMWDQPDELIETLALAVAEDIKSSSLADRRFAQETALLILYRLLARHSDLVEPRDLAEPKAQGDFRWAIEFMIDNLEKPLIVDQLAVLAKMSTFSFTRGFTRIYGKTPTSYLRQLRLERAKELLLRTSLPIAAVALRVGYSDAAHFVIAFKRDAGATPRSYRLNQGNQPAARPIDRLAPL
jgi:AraC-like DNA-binding protein